MLTDSTGLGYTIRRGEILVHYPTRAATDGSQSESVPGSSHRYEAGWPIGAIPAMYALEPPNAITAERVRLWTELQTSPDADDG